MFSAATKTGSQPSAAANYIEDVFSTYLYTGTGASLSINNGIDLAGKGGLVWFKRRDAVGNNSLSTTGITGRLLTDTTGALNTNPLVDSYNSNGFSTVSSTSTPNQSGGTFVSWTFRKQPKFFDVVTYTGTGSLQSISHSLGSTPAMIIVKNLTTGGYNWVVYHKDSNAGNGPENTYLYLNTTAASANSAAFWGGVAPTSTTFSVNTNGAVNQTGWNYVAYLFAHNAGGFGTSGTDNVISCGSFTTDASAKATVNLGYEPQYILYKGSGGTGNWYVADSMRGLIADGANGTVFSNVLYPNTTGAETTGGIAPTATGFKAYIAPSQTYIYMAIRRPMKVPTDATTVFSPITSSTNQGTKLTTGFPVDWQFSKYRSIAYNNDVNTRLIGVNTTAVSSGFPSLQTNSTAAEADDNATQFWDNTGFQMALSWSGNSSIFFNFARRPGFFDVVCYTGTLSPGAGGSSNINHNLGVAPELLIVKSRNLARGWPVYSAPVGVSKTMFLSSTLAATTVSDRWAGTTPTSTVFTVGDSNQVNELGTTYVAYLFATCPGVSKVGSYTGTGATQTINCGFTGGARFVLIKRTDSTGDWYVYDTARGMTTLVDPYLLLNSTAAESATLGSVTSTAGGFTVNASILAAINTSGASYIYLAIA